MARKSGGDISGERIRRILQQAEAHGGFRQLDLPYGQRANPLARHEPSRSWEQLRFPWGH